VALTAFTSSTGDLIHEAGGLEADVSAYTDGIYGQASSVTIDIDTIAEIETAIGGTNILTETEIDASSELLALMDDETGTGLLTFATAPTFTTNITAPLVIGGTAVGSTLTLKSTSGSGTTDAIIFQVGNNGAVEGGRFTTIGELGLGTTTPHRQLTLSDSAEPQLAFTDAGVTSDIWEMRNAGGNLYFATSSKNTYATSSLAAVEFQGTGKPGIAISSTTPFATLAVNPSSDFSNQFVVGSSTATTLLLDNRGHLFLPKLAVDAAAHTYTMCGAATTFEAIWDTTTCVLSAAKFKTNIEDLDIGLEELLKVRPVQFNYKPTGDETYDENINIAHQQIGLIADEVEKIDSRLVTYDNKGEIKGFNYEQYTSWLTKAIQEMWSSVTNHESRIDKLERENMELKTRLEKLENAR
jgi:hypothetical protein